MFFMAVPLALLLSSIGLGIVAYLWLVNEAITTVPDEVLKISPHRWTEEEMKETCERVEKNPIDFAPHLPPKLDRRYVVVGGSGLVGGYLILHLLKRGQSAESIRNIDFQAPMRDDMLTGAARKVQFVQADISSEDSTREAFDKAWPASVAKLPLTVLHIAAVINFTDRMKSMMFKVNSVNFTGTANVMGAAKKAGADVFIATSSASIAARPVGFWIWPFQAHPTNYFQTYGEEDALKPLRDHYDYYGIYPVSKANAERLVMVADSPDFRTGCIRPANGIYGTKYDQTVGTYLNRADVPTWISFIVQNFVDAENISISHLDLEKALLTPESGVGGQTFVITDPNAPIAFSDIYNLLSLCAVTPFKTINIPPVLMLLLCYPMEWYVRFKQNFSSIGRLLPTPSVDVAMLQPTIFNISTAHLVASDAKARQKIGEGGIGYKGVRTTLEGMCTEVVAWNREHKGAYPQKDVDAQIASEIRNIGAVPAAVGG